MRQQPKLWTALTVCRFHTATSKTAARLLSVTETGAATMVVFTCNSCGDAVKKAKVEQHYRTVCPSCCVSTLHLPTRPTPAPAPTHPTDHTPRATTTAHVARGADNRREQLCINGITSMPFSSSIASWEPHAMYNCHPSVQIMCTM